MTRALYADLGKIGYQHAMEIQNELAALRREDKIPDVIIFAEHSPALLFGRKITSFSDSAISAAGGPLEHAKSLGVDVHHTQFDSATYVGPGQVAVYPIMDYTRLFRPRDAAGYQSAIDNIILDSLQRLGIKAELQKNITVNIDGTSHRIASKAVAMGQKVALHGFHLHVAAESTKHFGLLNTPDSFASAEHVLGYAPAGEEVRSAVLDSIRLNMKYDKIEECKIEQTENGLLITKK